MWLGETRGELSDWATQQWVVATGRRVDLARDRWLAGPVGPVRGIGPDFFPLSAKRRGLRVIAEGAPRGLLRSGTYALSTCTRTPLVVVSETRMP